MSKFLTPPNWYDQNGSEINIFNNTTYTTTTTTGPENTAIGTSAVAGRPSSEGASFGAVAVGSQAEAKAPNSIAVGSYNVNIKRTVQALGSGFTAIGGGTITSADAVDGIAIGRAAAASVQGGIAIGGEAEVSVQGGIAIGEAARVTKSNVIQLGSNTTTGYTLSVGDGRMSLNIGSTVQSNWVSATSNNISQGLYLVRYGAGKYINTVYLMAPITVKSTEGPDIINDWYFPFKTEPSGIFYYLKVDTTSSASALSITPVYYNTSTSDFVTMGDGASVMLFKIL